MSLDRALLSFKSPTCQPCKRLAAALDAMEAERAGIKLITIDVTEDQAMTQKYHVMSVPTLIALVGDQVVAQQVGFSGPAPIRALLAQLQRAQPA